MAGFGSTSATRGVATGITLTHDGGGRALTVHMGRRPQLFGATFTDLEGLLGALRHNTCLGHGHWALIHPEKWAEWWRYFHDQTNMSRHDGACVFT